jgi:hypothetical protein
LAAFWLLCGLIALFAAGKTLWADTLDQDLFWHLRVAEQLRTDGIGPLVDNLSYESIKTPWTPYSWLAELGMKWTWDHLGWRGAVACDAALSAVILLLVAAACRALAGPGRRLAGVIATAFAAFFVIPYLSFRPVTLAILLLATCTWLLLRDRRREGGSRRHSRAVWFVVPLTALLANVHLCAVFVPLWVGCLLAGAICERRDVRRYATMLALVCLACLATPMLPGAARTAWFYRSHDVMVASGLISELKPIYLGKTGAVAMTLAAALFVCAILNRRRLRAGEWFWLLVATALMFRLAKFTPMFGLIAGPALAATMPAVPPDALLRRPIVSVVLAVALCASIGQVVIAFPSSATPMERWVNRRGPGHDGYPCAAADDVERHVAPRSGRLINEFNWGGYLAWRLGGRYQVFVDGRTQVYPPAFWRATYLGGEDDLVGVLRATGADVAILPVRGSRFRPALVNRLGWRSVYRDDFAEVLLPP